MNMPKFCSAPKCSSSSSDRRSFFKFPLQDPARLQLWLRNMGREGWTPSRHQYICQEHFIPSCFKVGGVRYLESNAVPTVFHRNQKRKASDEDENNRKRLRSSPCVSDGAESHSLVVYEITVETSQQTEAGPDSPVSVNQTWLSPGGSVPAVPSVDGYRQGASTCVNPEQARTDCAAVETLLCVDEISAQDEQVLAYVETIPSVLPSEASLLLPDVVLCSALSPEPISSTLPIVSKHQLADVHEEEESLEKPNPLLEEHRYHKLSLEPRESLLQLQRKVKLLQQRHRRHVTKLLRLETTLNQLRQNQLLDQERLQLLERAYVASGGGPSDRSDTAAIVYEDDAAACSLAPLMDADEGSN